MSTLPLLPMQAIPDLARRRALLATLAAAALAGAGCSRVETAPAFHYTLLDGSQHDSSALRGQVLLVNFWATSCAVCLREMPALVAVHQRWHGQGLQMLAVAVQHDAPALVAAYAERKRLPFGVVIDNTGAIARSFGGISATPTMLLIGKRGDIVWRTEGQPDTAALQRSVERSLAAAG